MRLLLVVLFILVPLAELAVIIQVGELIGVWWTIAVLLAVSIAGAWLIRREGTRTWSAFRGAMAQGRMPQVEVVDGALVLFGGALLLTPGFLSDILGLSLVFPATRVLWNRLIRTRARSFLFLGAFGGDSRRPPSPRGDGRVEVIDVDRDRPPS